MNHADRLERDLAVWFTETAMPSKPDYTDEIVREATRRRQRPRWTFAPAWLQGRVALPVAAWRTRIAWAAGVLVLIASGCARGRRDRREPAEAAAAVRIGGQRVAGVRTRR
jgi:hypothetical protein